MPQDALHVRQIAKELHTALVGGKINRITQADKEELTLYIYTEKRVVKLLLSTNASFARVCLTEHPSVPLPVAPGFCMLLRKHLLGAEILSVRQVAFERIVEIDFFCQADFFAGKRTLVCELMGKYSNLVLVEDGKILGALKTTSLEVGKRVLLPGAKYEYPPEQDKLSPFDKAGISSRETGYFSLREKDEKGIADFLFENVVGIASSTAREMSKLCKGEVADFVGDFCGQERRGGYLLFDGEKPIDFFAFPVAGAKEYPSLGEAQDAYFSTKQSKKSFETKKNKLLSTLRGFEKKQRKHLQEITEKLLEAQGAEENRKKGELLTANLYRVARGMAEIEVDDYYTGERVKIALDTTLPPAKNAQKYYKLYTKQKKTTEILTPRKADIEETLVYLESIAFSVGMATTIAELAEIEREIEPLVGSKKPTGKKGKKEEPLSLPRRYEIDGFVIKAGKNNLQNDRLLKEAGGEDIWLHVQKYHSSHVVLFTDGRKATDKALQAAAEICAYYSEAREGEKIPVDYCKRQRVKKAPHAKAGAAHYNGYQTMLVTPNAHCGEEK
ncbi:MAG: NFACT family protein [Clostridia bacterium]|nr:NFACT family protein [Clostridia bacterium]